MKLLYCRKCQDILKMVPMAPRKCWCSVSSGKLNWDTSATVRGEHAEVIVIDNESFELALSGKDAPRTGINAWLVPHEEGTSIKWL